jgi:hypothetical protein
MTFDYLFEVFDPLEVGTEFEPILLDHLLCKIVY